MRWEWLAMLVGGVIAALLFRRYVGFLTRVHAHSMWPTLRPGQLLFTRSVLHGRRIRHGDIAVVQSAELGQRVVKRVLGLPGDRLVFVAGRLVRNGEQLTEPYVVHPGGESGSWLVDEYMPAYARKLRSRRSQLGFSTKDELWALSKDVGIYWARLK